MNQASTSPATSCDVFVIGGGPAGSTIAAVLAERGLRVVIAERERHPRFHIGESLLPLNLPLFERLGVAQPVAHIGMPKYGAEFNSPQHAEPVTFNFERAWDKDYPYAYHVRRSQFDELLFRNCIERGAQGLEECRVTHVELDNDAVNLQAKLADGSLRQWRAGFLVDASGRDTFLGNQLGIKQRNPRHASAALYGHFTGAARLEGRAEGNISVFWFEHGWFWFIPLLDGTTSVGAVCWPSYLKSRKTDPTTFLLQTIELCPALAARLRHAQLATPVTATGNYSYRCTRMSGDRFLLVGDAYAFVDPVFSSGVMLAMNSALLGADAVEARLRAPRRRNAALRRFERGVHHGLAQFSWFVYRMTTPAMRSLLMRPRNVLRMEEAVLSLLAGDLFRGTPIYRSLAAFKLLYYAMSLAQLRASLAAWRRRRRLIQDIDTETRGSVPA